MVAKAMQWEWAGVRRYNQVRIGTSQSFINFDTCEMISCSTAKLKQNNHHDSPVESTLSRGWGDIVQRLGHTTATTYHFGILDELCGWCHLRCTFYYSISEPKNKLSYESLEIHLGFILLNPKYKGM